MLLTHEMGMQRIAQVQGVFGPYSEAIFAPRMWTQPVGHWPKVQTVKQRCADRDRRVCLHPNKVSDTGRKESLMSTHEQWQLGGNAPEML